MAACLHNVRCLLAVAVLQSVALVLILHQQLRTDVPRLEAKTFLATLDSKDRVAIVNMYLANRTPEEVSIYCKDLATSIGNVSSRELGAIGEAVSAMQYFSDSRQVQQQCMLLLMKMAAQSSSLRGKIIAVGGQDAVIAAMTRFGKSCTWSVVQERRYSAGLVDDDASEYTSFEAAQKSCLSVGAGSCKAVTCTKTSACTKRRSSFLFPSPDEVTKKVVCVQSDLDFLTTSCKALIALEPASLSMRQIMRFMAEMAEAIATNASAITKDVATQQQSCAKNINTLASKLYEASLPTWSCDQLQEIFHSLVMSAAGSHLSRRCGCKVLGLWLNKCKGALHANATVAIASMVRALEENREEQALNLECLYSFGLMLDLQKYELGGAGGIAAAISLRAMRAWPSEPFMQSHACRVLKHVPAQTGGDRASALLAALVAHSKDPDVQAQCSAAAAANS